jgi:hypothetical protein
MQNACIASRDWWPEARDFACGIGHIPKNYEVIYAENRVLSGHE